MARPRKNIDPEQVRKLAGWGLTQYDIASLVGCSHTLSGNFMRPLRYMENCRRS